jgi:hypothetical protein
VSVLCLRRNNHQHMGCCYSFKLLSECQMVLLDAGLTQVQGGSLGNFDYRSVPSSEFEAIQL